MRVLVLVVFAILISQVADAACEITYLPEDPPLLLLQVAALITLGILKWHRSRH